MSFDGLFLAGPVERTFPFPEYGGPSLISQSNDDADDDTDSTIAREQRDKLINLKVPKKLEIILLQKGMSQREIAEKMGVYQPKVSDWLNGNRFPNSKSLINFAEF
jgi:predicted XRE-type DNA-binding protein